ncbi:MAG: PepSY domain-containing protein [Gemmatimonadaceae bacterium]|nr:PepSY domain-containing protein [Gloeobacterales cyanobacterium ES-bin-141]
MKSRGILFAIHQIAGLTVGLLLLVIGLSGSSVVFWQQIDLAITPELQRIATTSQVSYDKMLEAARAENTGEPLLGVVGFEGNVRTPVSMTAQKQYRQYFIDPRSYQVIGSRIFQQSPMGWLYTLHTQLLAGDAGLSAVGVLGIVMVVVSITGLSLWPGWRKLGAGLSVRLNAPWPVIAYDLHKLTGLVAFTFLMLLGATGAAMAFRQPFDLAIHRLSSTPQPALLTSRVIPGQVPLPVDVLASEAVRVLPGGRLESALLAAKPDGVVQLFYDLEGEGAASHHAQVHLDQYSGRVLRVDDGRKPSAAQAIINWVGPLHYGTYGGAPVQALYVLVGLAPGTLFLTGFSLWLRKLGSKPRRETGVAPGE